MNQRVTLRFYSLMLCCIWYLYVVVRWSRTRSDTRSPASGRIRSPLRTNEIGDGGDRENRLTDHQWKKNMLHSGSSDADSQTDLSCLVRASHWTLRYTLCGCCGTIEDFLRDKECTVFPSECCGAVEICDTLDISVRVSTLKFGESVFCA